MSSWRGRGQLCLYYLVTLLATVRPYFVGDNPLYRELAPCYTMGAKCLVRSKERRMKDESSSMHLHSVLCLRSVHRDYATCAFTKQLKQVGMNADCTGNLKHNLQC
jgi:hypothetical protein